MAKKKKEVRKKYRPLCSGWGIFPDGKKCKGCQDCGSKTNKNPLE